MNSRTIILDIETNTKHDTIWCCVTKDIGAKEVNVWTEPKKLSEYLKPNDKLVGHNLITFDLPILNRLWNLKTHSNPVADTLVMSRLLNPQIEGGHSLSAWGKRLGNHKEDFTDFDGGLTQEMIDYCIQDVHVTDMLYNKLSRELQDWGESVELEHEVASIISDQERHGFMLDRTKATCLISGWKHRLSDIEESLQGVFPPIVTDRVSEKTGKALKPDVEVFNPGSRQQIAKRLIGLGWKPKKFTEKGQVVVDETVLAGVDIPEAKLIAEYLLIQKRVSQVSSWLDCVQEDGRVHGKVFTNGAVTGRMTHNSPNMAQVPSSGSPWGKDCRDCWIVPEGYKLVGIDASGLELRMLAHYMEDEDYVRAVVEGQKEDGTDIHTKNQIAAGLKTRDQAKTFIYALLYGAGPGKIGLVVGGSEREGKRLIETFLANTPALEKLRTKVSRNAEKGWLKGLDGRHLQIRSAHAALNTLLQGAGAIVMKKALVLLDRKIKAMKLDAKFVANVHDEWQIEVAEKDADMVAAMGIQSIRQAGQKFKLNCPLDGEANIGYTWGDTH